MAKVEGARPPRWAPTMAVSSALCARMCVCVCACSHSRLCCRPKLPAPRKHDTGHPALCALPHLPEVLLCQPPLHALTSTPLPYHHVISTPSPIIIIPRTAACRICHARRWRDHASQGLARPLEIISNKQRAVRRRHLFVCSSVSPETPTKQGRMGICKRNQRPGTGGDASRGLSVAEDGETGLVCDWWEGVFGDSALCDYCGFENSAIKKLAQS